jgi:hypothetical protein
MWPAMSTTDEHAVPNAASSCAPRPPPSSLLVRATRTTVTAIASAGTTRSAATLSPNRAIESFAIMGVSGGVSK